MIGLGSTGMTELLLCGMVIYVLWWMSRFHRDEESEDPGSLDAILRDAAEARRRRRRQPPLPTFTDEHEVLGLAYETGRDCRVLTRQVRFIVRQPLFRLACCILGGALLGHLIHATFAGGSLGVIPRAFDLAFMGWTGLGAAAGLGWGWWAQVEVPVTPARQIKMPTDAEHQLGM
jgi:hypothetical protein